MMTSRRTFLDLAAAGTAAERKAWGIIEID